MATSAPPLRSATSTEKWARVTPACHDTPPWAGTSAGGLHPPAKPPRGMNGEKGRRREQKRSDSRQGKEQTTVRPAATATNGAAATAGGIVDR